MTAGQQQPTACKLSGEARQDRRAWIAALVRDVLRSSERDDLTLRLRFAPEAVQRIQDMVRKEQACCSFLTFEMEERPQELWLIIRAPEAARAAADVLFSHFTHRWGRYNKFSHDAGHGIFRPISRAMEIAAKSANTTEDTTKAAQKQPTDLLPGANTTCSAGGP